MKYELLKDLPGVKAGAVAESINGVCEFKADKLGKVNVIAESDLILYPDWFRPVQWKPQNNETFYFINSFGEIVANVLFGDGIAEKFIEISNCFPTTELAEKALAEIKEVLKKNREAQI